MSTRKFELLYVQDLDGSLWLAYDPKHTIYKKLDRGQWMAENATWIRIDPETKESETEIDLLSKFIDLSNIPEPSWNDSEPISIFVTLTVNGYGIY